MLRNVALISLVITLISACSSNTECAGYVNCEMEVSPLSKIVTVGGKIELEFDLYAKDNLVVDIFDDPLCGLWFSATPSPSGAIRSTRNCATSESKLPDKSLAAAINDSKRSWSWVVAQNKRLLLGPDKHTIYQISADTQLRSDGAVTIIFADDVYFSFCDKALVFIGLRPHYNTFLSSGEGSFGDHLLFEQIDGPDGASVKIEAVEIGIGHDEVRKWQSIITQRGCANEITRL